MHSGSSIIKIYTDGSCHTQHRIGSWVAFIFMEDEKHVLKDVETDTTHNRMELQGVISALEYLQKENKINITIEIYSDSQYVIGLEERKLKLTKQNFKTRSGNSIQNADLVQKFYNLTSLFPIRFIKVKAHQKTTDEINYNREADKLVRSILRTHINNIKT